MNARLMVLGLLAKAPLHGYDVRKQLEVMRADAWADVLPGSVYHALNQMQKEGLVEVASTERTGHRLRAVFAITDAGRREYLNLLRRAWTIPPRPFPTGLYAAIAFIGDLPRPEALALIDALIPAAEREIVSWREGEVAKGETHAMSETTRAVFANGREHLEADVRLLRELRGLLAHHGEAAGGGA